MAMDGLLSSLYGSNSVPYTHSFLIRLHTNFSIKVCLVNIISISFVVFGRISEGIDELFLVPELLKG